MERLSTEQTYFGNSISSAISGKRESRFTVTTIILVSHIGSFAYQRPARTRILRNALRERRMVGPSLQGNISKHYDNILEHFDDISIPYNYSIWDTNITQKSVLIHDVHCKAFQDISFFCNLSFREVPNFKKVEKSPGAGEKKRPSG